MDLTKLFEMQKVLDDRIIKEHHLEGMYLLENKILSLLVEIGELANETRCFKHWSNKGPSPKKVILEEFVDGVHFFISLAIDLKIKPKDFTVSEDFTEDSMTETFNALYGYVSSLRECLQVNVPASISLEDLQEMLHDAFQCFIGLAERHLEFTWEEIEQAYFEKNKVNHQRQDSGVY